MEVAHVGKLRGSWGSSNFNKQNSETSGDDVAGSYFVVFHGGYKRINGQYSWMLIVQCAW